MCWWRFCSPIRNGVNRRKTLRATATQYECELAAMLVYLWVSEWVGGRVSVLSLSPYFSRVLTLSLSLTLSRTHPSLYPRTPSPYARHSWYCIFVSYCVCHNLKLAQTEIGQFHHTSLITTLGFMNVSTIFCLVSCILLSLSTIVQMKATHSSCEIQPWSMYICTWLYILYAYLPILLYKCSAVYYT